MRIIVGLGNPGKRYENNRHNVGFMFLDYLADSNSLRFIPSRGDYNYASGQIGNNSFLLVKPATYVNRTGTAVKEIIEEYNIDLSDLLVVVDDINLNLGYLRVRRSGGDGGHNGMNSIIYQLNSDQIPRVRIGVGKEFSKGEMADYVLSDFSQEEKEILKKSFAACSFLTEEFIKGGIKQLLDANSRISSPDTQASSEPDSDEETE